MPVQLSGDAEIIECDGDGFSGAIADSYAFVLNRAVSRDPPQGFADGFRRSHHVIQQSYFAKLRGLRQTDSEKFVVHFLGHQIEELDLIFDRDPKSGVFRLFETEVCALEQRPDRYVRLRRQRISGAGDAATRRRNVVELQVFYLVHADTLAISLALKSKDLAQAISAAASLLDYITPRSGDDRPRDRGSRGFVDTASHIMIAQLVKYLRDSAQACVRLARTCPHLSTSQGLEELATDLMGKAKELEELSLH